MTLVAAVPAGAGAATPPPTPQLDCGLGSRPEPGMQGRVPSPGQGYWCNAKLIGHEGMSGGYRVHRFVDRAGHECAYYDTTLLFPLNAQNYGSHPTGVAVLDVSDPANPRRTTTLSTLAMQSPHESLNISKERGLLAAVYGTPGAAPGVVDVYDLNADCRQPELQASAPVAFLGHESGFAPDGKTFYATSLFDGHVTAVDLTNPRTPTPVTVFENFSHGMNTSDDGKRGYMAGREIGLQIVDLSEIQDRKPLPQVREVSRLTWDTMSIPQNAVPITIKGRPYVMEVDEFSVAPEGGSFPEANGARVGAARLIDVSDETKPKLVSDLRLEVHQPENRAQLEGDPGAANNLQGYAGHYCNVPRRKDPGIVACSFILSGLRVFDITDPEKPKEIAYFVAPAGPSPVVSEQTNYAMSSPDFVPERDEIWYSDGNSGFYVVRLANGVWPHAGSDCVRGSKVGFKIHRSGRNRVVRVEAFVDGKRRLVRTGRDVTRIELSGLPRTGKMTIRIVATHNSGSKVVSTRSWNGCRKGRPSVRRVPRR
jgi:hypothetical protein